ncbi:nitroreductase family protein [Diaphorobacter caeni]|uniref:nitroreductase family protein n=1 Tax=Diaphorobacter caeni TaxID=2784387 RepID=UPI001E4D9802|nr:nitroreductase [Diaphorobacter caeni]
MHAQDSLNAMSAEQALGLMQTRRTVRPKNMTRPGPDIEQLEAILSAAAHAPDHGRAQPWRLIQVPARARDALAQAFVDALREREPDASAEQLLRAREKAHRSPELLLMVATRGDDAAFAESCTAAGCALQNMLLAATALGFASGLTSGGSLQSASLRRFFRISDNEHAICFLSLGTLAERGQKMRGERPCSSEYLSVLNTVDIPVGCAA